MINVNQLTEQLRMLPDAVLQRVAMMYKQDPYILPMVISEGMARKKLRAAGQAQAARPLPKVADQAIASLGYTPEESGIAGLAAPNMQNMADGGIAGEADDFEFAQRSEPVVRMAEGGVARYAGDSSSLVRLPNPAAQFYSSQLSPSSDPLTELHRQAYAFEAERIAAEKDLAAAEAVLQRYGVRQRQTDPEGYAQAVAARDAAAKRRDTAAKRYSQESGRLAPQDEAERAFKKPTAMTGEEAKLYAGLYENAPKAPLMPIPDVKIAGQTPPAAAGAGAQARPPAAPGITPTPAAARPGRAEDILENAEREGLRRLLNMQLDADAQGQEEREAYRQGRPKGEALSGLAARLKQMEEAEPGERKQAQAMAIFNAGLSMMAGNSPHALQNIAKGALAGSGEYAGALKEMKQAAKERIKLEADIEQARRAEARGDNETALKLLQRQNDRVNRISDAMVDLGVKTGQSKADVVAKVDLLRTELNSRERIAAAQLAQEPGDIRSLRALMADPNLLDMLRTSKAVAGESSLLQKMALEAIKDPAGFKILEKTNPGAYAAVMAEVAKLGGTSSGVSPAESALISKYLNKP